MKHFKRWIAVMAIVVCASTFAQEQLTVLARISEDSLIVMDWENFDQELCYMENPICAYVFDSSNSLFIVITGGFYPGDV